MGRITPRHPVRSAIAVRAWRAQRPGQAVGVLADALEGEDVPGVVGQGEPPGPVRRPHRPPPGTRESSRTHGVPTAIATAVPVTVGPRLTDFLCV
jgi:hypothetical protein